MSNRPKLIIVVILLFLLGSFWYFRPRVTESEVEDLLTRNLPVGTHKSDVEAFLDSRAIEHHSFIVKSESEAEGTKTGSEAMQFITGTIPDAQRGLLTRYEIQIWLYLDEEERLIGQKVMKAGTMGHSILGL